MRHLKIPLLLLALVGLIAFAGCGGDDDESTTEASSTTSTTETTESTETEAADGDYAAELTTILTDFGTSFQTLGASLQGTSDPAELSSGIGELESQLGTTIDDLNALEPPAEAQEGQDQMVAAFEGLSGELTEVADAVDAGDPQAAKTAARDLQAAAASFQQEFTAGITSIAESGVAIGPGVGG